MKKRERDELIEDICTAVENSYGKLKSLNSFSTKSTRRVLDIVESVVMLIEEHSDKVESLSGKSKKKLAVDILNRLINIKVKFVPRIVMEKLEGWVIETVIELVVGWLNKKFDKRWLEND